MVSHELEAHRRYLAEQLGRLSPQHRLVFAASCAQVLQPNYGAFDAESGWGQPAILHRALDVAWACAESVPVRNRVLELIEQCEEVSPDTDEFQTALASPALDAVIATIESLRCCLSVRSSTHWRPRRPRSTPYGHPLSDTATGLLLSQIVDTRYRQVWVYFLGPHSHQDLERHLRRTADELQIG
jgi:hypothetical protein